MTTVVQTASASKTSYNSTAITATFGSATTAGNSIVVVGILTFDGSGGTLGAKDGSSVLTWTVRHNTQEKNSSEGTYYVAFLADSLNSGSSISTVSITGSGGGGFAGELFAYEVSGGTASLDFATAADTSSSVTSLTATGGTETGTSDFLLAGMCVASYNSTLTGLTTASGSPSYTGDYTNTTTSFGHAGGQISHRIETSAISSPTASWSWSGSNPVSAFIAAYSFGSGGGGAISGTADLTLSQSATLAGAGALSASGTLTFSQSAALTGVGALLGSGAIIFGADGTLAASAALSGAAALTFGANGALTGAGALIGSSALSFDASATPFAPGLTGIGALTFAADGTLSAQGALKGTAALAFDGSGNLAGTGEISGVSALTFDASGTLQEPGMLSGVAAFAFDGAATLEGSAVLAGVASLTFDASLGSGAKPAGYHRKRYGVRDGDKLLLFDTRAQADAAKAAIAARSLPALKNRKRLKVKPLPPHETVTLASVAEVAIAAGEASAYRRLVSEHAYTELARKMRDWQVAEERLQRERRRREEREAQERDRYAQQLLETQFKMAAEEEEIAMILLHL